MSRKLIGILAGIACLVIGVIILISYINAQRTQTGVTTATIIRVDSEMQTDSDGFDTRWYYPVVEYTVNEQKYEARLSEGGTTNSLEYKEGQEVEIQYNPNNPEELSKKGSIGGLIGGIVFIAFGVIALGAALLGKI